MATRSGTDDGLFGDIREPRSRDALPGELKPLEWVPGRGPITDEEALGVLRRRRRVELAGRPKKPGARRGVPDELPGPDEVKRPTLFRLPPLDLARAHARAELEGVTLTAILQELLADYAAGVPDRPDVVADRMRARRMQRTREARP